MEILPNTYSLKFRVQLNEEIVSQHVETIINEFSLDILLAESWEIFLIVESKMHLIKI